MIRASLLLATLTAAAAPALAQRVEITTAPIVSGYYYVPPDGRYYAVPATTEYYITPATPLANTYEPPITVYGVRVDEDTAITSDVVDVLASDPRLTGYIGVETRNSEVHLNGLLTTPGQVERAGRNAKSVDGVRDVHNNVRARVGG